MINNQVRKWWIAEQTKGVGLHEHGRAQTMQEVSGVH